MGGRSSKYGVVSYLSVRDHVLKVVWSLLVMSGASCYLLELLLSLEVVLRGWSSVDVPDVGNEAMP